MIKLILALVCLSCPARAAEKKAVQEASVTDRFDCTQPAGWKASRDKGQEASSGIQKLELSGPRADKAPVLIYAAFYGKTNASFSGYRDYIDRNSRNILGEKENETEKFTPVTKSRLSGREVYVFGSEIREYVRPESSSGETVTIMEKFYVAPEQDGFFVLHYYAPAKAYDRYLPVFKKFAAGCRLR